MARDFCRRPPGAVRSEITSPSRGPESHRPPQKPNTHWHSSIFLGARLSAAVMGFVGEIVLTGPLVHSEPLPAPTTSSPRSPLHPTPPRLPYINNHFQTKTSL